MNRKIFVYLLLLVCLISSEEITEYDLEKAFGDKECIEGKLVFEGSSILLVKMQSDNENTKTAEQINAYTTMETKDETQTHILVNIPKAKEEEKNPLLLLNEISQMNKIQIDYLVISEEGPPHDRTFNLRLNLGDEIYFAKDKTLKAAKTALARKALAQTKFEKPTTKSTKVAQTITDQPPTVILNNIATKLGMKVEYINEQIHKHRLDNKYTGVNYVHVDSSKNSYFQKLNATLKNAGNNNKKLVIPTGDESPRGPFRVRVNVGDKTFFGEDMTIQGAKHKAALSAINHFKMMSLRDAEACLERGEVCNKLAIKSPISLVYETASRKNIPVNFELIEQSGPAHKRTFVMMCKVGDLISKGEGPSKSDAKNKAAEKMLKSLDSIVGSEIIVTPPKKSKNNKKKKIRRGIIDNVKMNLVDTVASVANVLSGKINDEDVKNNDFSEDTTSTKKNELLQLSEKIGFTVDFTSTVSNGKSLSLVTLNRDPSYVCVGSHSTKEGADEIASGNALKIILMDFSNVIVPKSEKEQGKESSPFTIHAKEEPRAHHDYKM